MKTIIIAGGSGFLGKVLENYFSKKGYTIKILTRNPKASNDIYWNAKDLGKWTNELENAGVVINLTGKSVDCRYTEKNKKMIYDSRINSTGVLAQGIKNCKNIPKVWINTSTATIYKNSFSKKMTENNGDIGNDFSMNTAKSWENEFNTQSTPKTRKIILRTAIVLGRHGGALLPLKKMTQFGLGGKQGPGNQKVSWIHEIDFAKSIEYLINHEKLNGIFNLCVPNPTDNKILMQSLRKVLKIPFGISHPKYILEFGAKLIGTETELILKSRNVIPKRLLENGYSFSFTNIESALNDLINN